MAILAFKNPNDPSQKPISIQIQKDRKKYKLFFKISLLINIILIGYIVLTTIH